MEVYRHQALNAEVHGKQMESMAMACQVEVEFLSRITPILFCLFCFCFPLASKSRPHTRTAVCRQNLLYLHQEPTSELESAVEIWFRNHHCCPERSSRSTQSQSERSDHSPSRFSS